MSLDKIKIFSGNANPELSGEIISSLNIVQGKALVGRFSDGESQVEILENVRGCDVFIIQPTCGPSPAETLMELLVIVDALKRSSAARITAVVPYFGYSRQDRRSRLTRVPITAKLAAKMVESAGVDRILTVDLHADQIQGFFNIPIDNIYAQPVLIEDILSKNYQDIVVVSPDVGGVVRARAAAKRLNDADLAIIDKRRPAPNMVKIMNVIGDVEGRTCTLIDDMVDTAGTLCQAASVLKQRDAKEVVAYTTHAVLSGDAINNINNSELNELVTTNTIPLNVDAANCSKIRQLSIAPTIAEVIKRISEEQSISTIFT
ncbi:ribose-phosphate pyrophosphokinase [Candidatus Ruthia endofausta]|uniref:Ribose-phosphate pyrophosphokinase n=1 Tax=Candidatus Ruthia endofausta TaxID=2738852 RepID=A0A6N0HQS9_9GAMM|nr:ribose-phosphate pyrophosphokinase [Candidatus Ruthia endofausta]QKQ24705.1 ribose-phosphate pyrophosphokinase [Candidatus Ruthia endofausta]